MVYRAVKLTSILIILSFSFFLYQYNYGDMYGGKKYQALSFEAEAKILLKKYKAEQDLYFKKIIIII